MPGVLISGRLPARGTATFTVRGSAAARGTVRVTSDLAVSGTLGGLSVTAKFGQAASAGDRAPLSLRAAIARGRLVAAGAAG